MLVPPRHILFNIDEKFINVNLRKLFKKNAVLFNQMFS